MTITCTIKLTGSDSIEEKVDLHCVPQRGDVIHWRKEKYVVEAIDHVMPSQTNQQHHEVIISLVYFE